MMPTIKLPPLYARHTTTSGCAYILDTGHDPSKASRTRYPSKLSGSEFTARQQTALPKHLAELDRENY